MESKYPHTMQDFMDFFHTEHNCIDYLFNVKWPDGFVCHKCGCKAYLNTSKGFLFKCKSCFSNTSLYAGSIFQDTKKPLRLWLQAIWYVTNQKNGVSACGLKSALGLGSYHTAWAWLHKLRRAMVRPGRDKLSGTIECDESYIGGEKKGKRGRGSENKAIVLIAAQQDGKRIGRIRLKHIADASAHSIETALEEMILPGSTIHTDAWPSYNGLEKKGYKHKVIRDDGTLGENLLPLCHTVSSLLKRWLLGTYQGGTQLSHLAYYLDEYTFRFNRRTSTYRGLLFHRLVEQAMAIDPVIEKELSYNLLK
ncbi:IS1595 family transposase ISDth3 [subsurface metagenome]|nr:MAG: IS1595 family transposase [Candidatus Atribacteria bacterium 1244-E10-H5-B2]